VRALLGVALLWSVSGVALAQAPEATDAPSAEALRAWAVELGSENGDTRRRAFESLTTLPSAWVQAVRDRASRLRRQRLDPEAAQQAVRRFRHGTGSRRADDMVDIAPGVLIELASTRDRVTLAMAERVALMRSMERLGGRQAGGALMDLLALNPGAFRWERRRLLHRQGLSLLPTLLDARSHSSPDIRRWARQAVPAVRGADAGRVVGALVSRPGALADTLRAWADARDFDAMPVVVTFVDAEDGRVREAARDAMRSYGQNGIWMLRRQFRSSLGEDAPSEWGWRRTFDELVRQLDERSLAPAREALAAGLAAAETGDLDEMRRYFDSAARLAPLLPERSRMAPGYGRWADAEMDAGRFTEARAAFLRAARLADDGEAEDLRARALLAEAEAENQNGIVDLSAYRLVTQLSPGQELAARRIAEQQAPGGKGWGGREVSMLLGACMAILGLLMLFGNELPAVAMARRAAMAGARMATSAGRSLRARAQLSFKGAETSALEGASWGRSIPLALMRPKASPEAAHDTTPGIELSEACSTAPGMDISAEFHSTAPGAAVTDCHDVYSTAPGIDAPADEAASVISVAEALGILQPAPKELDPFEDSAAFGDADAFEGTDALFD